MQEIKAIFDELQATSGKKDKENILIHEKNNKEFRDLLYFLLNPYIVTGVGKKKLNKFKKHQSDIHIFKNFFEVIDHLNEYNSGSDETVKSVAAWINSQDEELHEFYRGIVRKDLKIGITSNTVNKVYGKGTIPDFKVQLAEKFHEHSHKVEGKEFVLTEKLDGMRCMLFVEDGVVKTFARSGNPILELVDIHKEAKELLPGVYDGELVIANADDFKDRDVLQETLKLAKKDGEKMNLIFHVFDFIPLEEFEGGISSFTYPARRKAFETIIGDNFTYIKVLPVLYQGTDLSVIPGLLKELEDQGKEGLMLNLCSSKYVTKRTTNLLKIKTMNTCDLRVIGFEEGEGKNQGTLGNLILDYKGFPLGCGSGLTDADRHEVWNNQDDYLGKIVEVQYFRESQNADGGLSVSFPVFVCWRDDKTEPSYY